MSNHPNRGGRNPSRNPKPAEVLAARSAAGLTQTQAADLLHTSLRAYQQWESGERKMHPAFWELFRMKTGRPALSAETIGKIIAFGKAATLENIELVHERIQQAIDGKLPT